MRSVGSVLTKQECLPKWDEDDRQKIKACREWVDEEFYVDPNWTYDLKIEYVSEWNYALLQTLPSEQLEEYKEITSKFKIRRLEHFMCKLFNYTSQNLNYLIREIQSVREVIKILVRADIYWNGQ